MSKIESKYLDFNLKKFLLKDMYLKLSFCREGKCIWTQMSSKARRGCLMLEAGGTDRYEPPQVVLEMELRLTARLLNNHDNGLSYLNCIQC